ncbi:MAG: hypothetical protein V7641_4753 [Blastocatellia bacterium]
MAKADTLNNEKKAKKQTRKPSAENAAATDEPQADDASKKTSATSSKTKAAAEAPSSASQTGSAQASSAQAQAASTEPATAAPSAVAAAGALDPALLPAQRGKLGVFGGPKDRGIKPDDKLALPTGKHFTFERVRSLNPKGFYCAMRWDYHALGKSIGEGQRWWANKKLVVTNLTNGVSVVVRAVDYGPPESTGLTIAVSPGAAEALAVEIGDEVEIAFADPRLPAGVVE